MAESLQLELQEVGVHSVVLDPGSSILFSKTPLNTTKQSVQLEAMENNVLRDQEKSKFNQIKTIFSSIPSPKLQVISDPSLIRLKTKNVISLKNSSFRTFQEVISSSHPKTRYSCSTWSEMLIERSIAFSPRYFSNRLKKHVAHIFF